MSRCARFFEILCRILLIIFNKRKTGDPCVYFPERIINRPDPCIYSQFFLMQLQLPVTWDNPDVAILLGGVEQFTYDLTANTEYDVAITVHNSSPEKDALATRVDVRWIEFGAGGPIRHPVASRTVDVPRWPGTGVVHVPWRTPATPGHFCLEVELTHPMDGNPANNLGWNNTQVRAAASEVETSIRIFNRWIAGPPKWALREYHGERPLPAWNVVELTVDSYAFRDAYGRDADPDVMFAERPPAWPARIEPHIFHFMPEETFRDIKLIVDAPAGPGAAERFNVTARQGGSPLGGVTVVVTRS